MSANYEVPFYANTPDGIHCFQAALKMVLKYFWPEKDFDWETLDKITAKQNGMWTWPMAGFCWLTRQGFEVIDIQGFDFARFAAEKENYLITTYGQQIADAQAVHSNIDDEAVWAKQFLQEVNFEKRIPAIKEIVDFLDKGFLVITNVNIRSLYDKEGYVGHSVVIKGYDETGLFLHDPGGQPRESIHTSFEQFAKGWDYPNKYARNLAAIKLPTT